MFIHTEGKKLWPMVKKRILKQKFRMLLLIMLLILVEKLLLKRHRLISNYK